MPRKPRKVAKDKPTPAKTSSSTSSTGTAPHRGASANGSATKTPLMAVEKSLNEHKQLNFMKR